MIEATGLTKLYDRFVAVNDLSLTVRPGEVLGLVGRRGGPRRRNRPWGVWLVGKLFDRFDFGAEQGG